MHPVIFWWLVVGTGFPFVHGVVWLRQTQRMMTMMRKTRSQCSCCLRRLALLGLPRGSPGVQRKQVIRMIWRLSCSPTMLTLFKRSWHWRSFCSRRQWSYELKTICKNGHSIVPQQVCNGWSGVKTKEQLAWNDATVWGTAMFVLTEGTIESSYLECGSHHLWIFFFWKMWT